MDLHPMLMLLGARETPEPLGAGGPDLTRYLMVCGMLLLAIFGLAWGFKRLVGGALRTRAAARSLQMLDVMPLGGKQRVAVVRCYDRVFALGLGEKEVSLIAEIDRVNAEGQAPAEPRKADKLAFLEALGRARHSWNQSEVKS
jgi:flagellar biogenesis protein FliO